MTIPKISIIIPVYNTELYLRDCLESVVNQTMREIEIICINDGSTDSSGAILDEYAQKDSRFSVIHQKNAGQGAARNRGLDIAKGDYIQFVDSDDWIELNACEIAYNTAQAQNLNAIGFEYIHHNTNQTPQEDLLEIVYRTGQFSGTLSSNIDKLEWGFYNGTSTCKFLWNKNFLLQNNIKFIEGVYLEDVEFIVHAAMALESIFVIPQVLYHYRITGISTTTSVSGVFYEYGCSIFNQSYQLIPENEIECQNLLISEKCKILYYAFFYKTKPELQNPFRRRLATSQLPYENQKIRNGAIKLPIYTKLFFCSIYGSMAQKIQCCVKRNIYSFIDSAIKFLIPYSPFLADLNNQIEHRKTLETQLLSLIQAAGISQRRVKELLQENKNK